MPTETSSYSEKNLFARYIILAIGVLINSFGVAFITKAALGTSPISSFPFVLSLKWPSVSFGLFTFVMNTGLIVLQIVLLRRDFQLVQLLQMVVNVVFSWFIDVSMGLLGWLDPQGVVMQVIAVVVGCAILGFGICVEIAPNVIMVPGEGCVRAIAAVTQKRFGTVKVLFDCTLVAIAIVCSFAFFGQIKGLGLGTIISALLVGRMTNIYNRYLKPLDRIRALSA